MIKQSDDSTAYKRTPEWKNSKENIIRLFDRYGFHDTIGHPLTMCLDFTELVDELIELRAKNPAAEKVKPMTESETITTIIDNHAAARACLTCAYEPKWKMRTPTEQKLYGHCRADCASVVPGLIREGQAVTHDGQPVTDCPGWEPKVDENSDPVEVPVTIELGLGILSFEEDDRAHIDRLTVALEEFNAQAGCLAGPKEESARTCLTCQHEPEWNTVSPVSDRLRGECKAIFSDIQRKYCVTRIGQVSYCGDDLVTDCLAWEPKADPS